MSKSYTPGDDADEIIARQIAKGNFTSADAVVNAGVRMLEEFEADIASNRRTWPFGGAITTRNGPEGLVHLFCGAPAAPQDEEPLQPRATIYWLSSRHPFNFIE